MSEVPLSAPPTGAPVGDSGPPHLPPAPDAAPLGPPAGAGAPVTPAGITPPQQNQGSIMEPADGEGKGGGKGRRGDGGKGRGRTKRRRVQGGSGEPLAHPAGGPGGPGPLGPGPGIVNAMQGLMMANLGQPGAPPLFPPPNPMGPMGGAFNQPGNSFAPPNNPLLAAAAMVLRGSANASGLNPTLPPPPAGLAGMGVPKPLGVNASPLPSNSAPPYLGVGMPIGPGQGMPLPPPPLAPSFPTPGQQGGADLSVPMGALPGPGGMPGGDVSMSGGGGGGGAMDVQALTCLASDLMAKERNLDNLEGIISQHQQQQKSKNLEMLKQVEMMSSVRPRSDAQGGGGDSPVPTEGQQELMKLFKAKEEHRKNPYANLDEPASGQYFDALQNLFDTIPVRQVGNAHLYPPHYGGGKGGKRGRY